MSSVEVKDLRVTRGSFTLSCTSWTLGSGLTVLVGLNGAGKTTFLEVLAGRLPVDQGSVVRHGVGPTMPQGALVEWPRSVHGFLTYIAALRGVRSDARPRRVADVVAKAGLESVADRSVSSLSGGWARRVLVAQCLLDESGALLLDEPTDSLDVGAARHVWQLLKEVSSSRPVLVATHHASAALEFADTMVAIDQGTVGPPVDGERIRTDAAHAGTTPDRFLLDFLGGSAS